MNTPRYENPCKWCHFLDNMIVRFPNGKEDVVDLYIHLSGGRKPVLVVKYGDLLGTGNDTGWYYIDQVEEMRTDKFCQAFLRALELYEEDFLNNEYEYEELT